MATTLVWSERNDPNAPKGAWRDCTYSSGLMGMVFSGFTKFPLGLYSVAEREALERSDNQPDETGASLDDLCLAMKNRYGKVKVKSAIDLLSQHHKRSDLGFVIQGLNGNLSAGHPLRRWDPGFTGAHAIFIVPTGDGVHVRWFDPEATNKYQGDTTDWPTVMKWIGNNGYFITFRVDEYASPVIAPPPVPPVVTPKVYTQAELDAAVKTATDVLNARISQVQAQLAAANETNKSLGDKILAARAALT